MATIESNLQAVREGMASACRAYARPEGSVTLVAVSKTFGLAAIQAAYAAGQRHFGENYVQECVEKVLAMSAWLQQCNTSGVDPSALHPTYAVASPQAGPLLRAPVWHFIGPLQSNKTRLIATHCDWVHGIDRLKIAERLSEQRLALVNGEQRPTELPPLQVCIQVNVSGESTKSGVMTDEVHALVKAVSALPGLKLRGLMCIPEPSDDPAQQRAPFAYMRELLLRMNNAGYALDTLSMGMSADSDAAIAEGATLVRVGSAIFGQRMKTSDTV